jgi:hypothetical protein
VAFDLTLSRANMVREESARADLTRALVNRFQLDLAATLGPLPPRCGGESVGGTINLEGTELTTTDSTTATTTASTGSTTTTTTETTTTTTTTTTDPASTDGTDPAASSTSLIPAGAGVVGTENQLTLFVARIPTALSSQESFDSGAQFANPADVRKVTYYLGPEGGLCRQEQGLITADGVGNSTSVDSTMAEVDLIAPEVNSVTFEYFDGSAWQSTWDGSALGQDGVAILGPPRAVRVTMVLVFPEPMGEERRKTVQQVIAIRAATSPAPASSTPTDGTTPTEGTP